MRRLFLSLAAAALVLLLAPKAHAFHEFGNWLSSASGTTPGAGALFASGGARDYNVTCAHCHTKAAGTIDATFTPSPAWGQKNGSSSYTPNTAYTITVKLVGETKGLMPKGAAINYNSFMLTFENQNGQTAGTYANDSTPTKVTTATCVNTPATTGTTLLVGPAGMPCYWVMARPAGNMTTWTFTWNAPAAGTGPVTLYYGMVDGDANATSLGDDVKVGTLKLVEGP